MKLLKTVGIAVAVIIALPLVIALFIKSEYAIERKISINKPKDEVFNYIKYLKNQDNFSTWAQMDPNMKKEFKGTDGTVGFVSSWDSDHEDVGKGEQEIIKIEEGKRLDFELRFYEPFESTDNAYMITEDNGSDTTVKWGFNGKMDYPVNILMLFMDMEEVLGSQLQEGLNNLKKELEG